jgi:hypothetical protein
MITNKYKIITYAILCLFLISSCEQSLDSDSGIKNSDFSELCDIYQDLSKSTDDLDTKEMVLTENILKKLPTLFNKLFIHINNNNADIRYQLIQQYAKQQNQLEWDCKAASTYYIMNF